MKRFVILSVFTLWHIAGLGQVTLAYHLKKGDIYKVKQKAEQIITQELDGATHVITNHIDGVLEFRVLSEVAQGYEIALTFKDLNLIITSSIEGELMNVKAKEVIQGDIQSKIFNTILENPVKLILSKTGDILKVQGGDSLVSKMANASGLKDDFAINLMKNSLKKEFGSEALSNSYKQMTFIYPIQKVSINDKWKNSYNGKLTTTNTWTLIGIADQKATIHGKANVTVYNKDPNTTMKLKGTQNTRIISNINTGFIIKMTVEGISTGVSNLVQLGDQELPTTIKSKITYELIKKEHVQQKL
ncbi:hypothetical protein KCTC52924_03804 [Arenibacter antarcticus]|uniref:DUF6263 family protein n=1 Tax=Arenibacter antarcticus TaxID=2040469 RepID=A0ABW5VEK1_9FLAO|nr:DUF6263 family protein [Arenibacter sp. H213]MCM4168242.1 hypothetical protein [Arenibacter sp. H213]